MVGSWKPAAVRYASAACLLKRNKAFLQICVLTDAISKNLKASQNTSQVKTLEPARHPQIHLTYKWMSDLW